MKMETENAFTTGRRTERGTAMVIAMFGLVIISLLGISITFSAGRSVDSSKNELLAGQAYYAAEAGVQQALYIMRGNQAPIGVSDTSASLASNKISLSIAATPATSNASGDSVAWGRLSKWLSYTSTSDTATVTLNPSDPITKRLSFALRVNDLGSGKYEVLSTGYGPMGAKKTLRVRLNNPGGALTDMPATIVTMGNNPTGNGGNSNAHILSGYDAGTGLASNQKPILGAIGAANATYLWNNSFSSDQTGTFETGLPSNYADLSTPNAAMNVTGYVPFGNSAATARQFVAAMTAAADTVVAAGGTIPSGALGTTSAPKIVVIEGDQQINAGSGAGILIVKGTLEFRGNASYDGIILCLGTGQMVRRGGGNGVIRGGILLGGYSANSNTFDLQSGFETNGGGCSDILYSSTAVNSALNLMTRVVVQSISTE
ncbi:MAG: pilus assembly PilX N-terminal domain-containing protein [Blastocatellia bacterium]